jgi:hypothetical protein
MLNDNSKHEIDQFLNDYEMSPLNDEKRAHVRSIVKIPVMLMKQILTGEIKEDLRVDNQKSTIINISTRGLAIFTNSIYSQGEDFYAKSISNEFKIFAKVKNVYIEKSRGFYVYGCSFVKIFEKL